VATAGKKNAAALGSGAASAEIVDEIG